MSEWQNNWCDHCVFAIALKEEDRKECRRFPPVPLMYSSEIGAKYPPLQRWTRACSEFRGKAPMLVPEGFDARPGAINKVHR